MPRATKPVEKHVALLRGINVGGKNSLPMKDLAAMFGQAGCADVATYIQSGNVVFSAPAPLIERLPALIAAQIKKKLKLEVPVLLRSHSELSTVAGRNPFLTPGQDTERLMVMFLASPPTASAIASLDPARSPPDEFAVRRREIYLRCPNGYGKSKLSNAYFDAKLGTTSTGRNWRTVLTLLEMTK
jgi:uncharacterized protein (DUF1697 family)